MKTVRIFSAPHLLIAAFLLIIISGEMLGGPYLLYLLLALPHGGIHALLAIGGIFCLVGAHVWLNWITQGVLKLAGCLLGVLLLAASLYTFFYNDTSGYNDGSFEQLLPLVSMILTLILAVAFLAFNISLYLKFSRPDGKRVLDSR